MTDRTPGRSEGNFQRALLPHDRIPVWTYVFIGVGLLAFLAVALLLMGRVPWCKCGYIKLWHGVVKSSENSQHLIDWYSFSHIIHGFAFYLALWLIGPRWPVRLRLVLALALEVSWEIFENTAFVIKRYRAATIALDYYRDSVVNSEMNVLATALGSCWPLTCRSGQTVALAVALEAWVGYVIRDNLTLNIIMLIYTIEAINDWQLGA
jgi:Protein of unknown function (DUF2585)